MSGTTLALRITTVAVLLFLLLPILAVVPLSFSSSALLSLPVPGFSLRWYQDLFGNGRWLLAARNSLIVGVATMVLATGLGTMAALGLFLCRFRGQGVVIALLSLPMVTPVIVVAVAMYFAFSYIGLASTLAGLVLAHTVLALPYVLITVLASLRNFDRTLLRAAATLGSPPVTTFRRVMLPLIAPGVASGAVFAFATSFDELVVSLFIAGPGQFTLPRQMYSGIHEFLSPTVTAAAVLLVVCSMLLLALAEWIGSRARRRVAGP
jgi:putative spermidine/putrescine transport system permease protein